MIFPQLVLAATVAATMVGSYVTVGEYPDTGGVEAVFTPAGDGSWTVVFDFDFQESEYTFSGTAEGNLDDGWLEGTVFDKSGERSFVFRGPVSGGRFEGRHAEIEHGGETPTGTMMLEREGPRPSSDP